MTPKLFIMIMFSLPMTVLGVIFMYQALKDKKTWKKKKELCTSTTFGTVTEVDV